MSGRLSKRLIQPENNEVLCRRGRTGDNAEFFVLLGICPQCFLRKGLRSSIHCNRVGPSNGDLLGDLKPIYSRDRASSYDIPIVDRPGVWGDIPFEVSGALMVTPGTSNARAATELITTICLILAFSAWRTMFRHPSFAA